MSTRSDILSAALTLLDEVGEAQFSTREVCALAKVTAPTLYHHFGNADGLLSAAIAEAFRQFLDHKGSVAGHGSMDALRLGWDNYVEFAAARPRLYAVMISRVLQGGEIAAAQAAFAMLVEQLESLPKGSLAMPVRAAADVVWSSANAASLLFVTARLRSAEPPTKETLSVIRDQALAIIAKGTSA